MSSRGPSLLVQVPSASCLAAWVGLFPFIKMAIFSTSASIKELSCGAYPNVSYAAINAARVSSLATPGGQYPKLCGSGHHHLLSCSAAHAMQLYDRTAGLVTECDDFASSGRSRKTNGFIDSYFVAPIQAKQSPLPPSLRPPLRAPGFSHVIACSAQNQWSGSLRSSRNINGSASAPMPIICW